MQFLHDTLSQADEANNVAIILIITHLQEGEGKALYLSLLLVRRCRRVFWGAQVFPRL